MNAMWRAWGTLLFLLGQDLGPPFQSEEHEIAIRPPAGWTRREGKGPFVARFTAREALKPPVEITLSHLYQPFAPTPLPSFVEQAKEYIGREYKGAKIEEDRPLTLAGRPAHRIAFTFADTLQIKTIVHRTNVEWYLLDVSMPGEVASRYRSWVEASLATFEIRPWVPGPAERAAEERGREILRSARIPQELLGERWFTIHLGRARTGRQRVKLSESEGGFALEVDVFNDFGEGGRDQTLARASFASGWRSQRLEIEQTKVGPKGERWQFRVSASLENGRVSASRDLKGFKEEKSFTVEEGTCLGDVADVARALLVRAGPGKYLLRTVSPFADEADVEVVEVGALDVLDLDGRRSEVHPVLVRRDRGRLRTYYYGADGSLVREGGAQDAFSIRAASKDEALKKD
jgi:hypothetical protein